MVRPLAFLLALDVAVVAGYMYGGWRWLALPEIPLSVFGAVIGVIAGFRNTSSYARWWEARIIWGAIVNGSRNFAREVQTMILVPDADPHEEPYAGGLKRTLILLQIAYTHALRHHLRGTCLWA